VSPGGPAGDGQDQITFQAGLVIPRLPGSILLNHEHFTITDRLIISGPGAGLLNIDAHGGSRVFQVNSDAAAIIDGLKILNGQAENRGGGILNLGTLFVTNCELIGNSVDRFDTEDRGAGGAIFNSGTLTVINSTLFQNSADFEGGGGIFNDMGTVTVLNSTLSRNSADFLGLGRQGGGIFNNGGTVTVTNSTLTENSVGEFGGEGGGI